MVRTQPDASWSNAKLEGFCSDDHQELPVILYDRPRASGRRFPVIMVQSIMSRDDWLKLGLRRLLWDRNIAIQTVHVELSDVAYYPSRREFHHDHWLVKNGLLCLGIYRFHQERRAQLAAITLRLLTS